MGTNPCYQGMEFRDDEHYATLRSSMLAHNPDLRRPEAEAIAYTEPGYSFSGAAEEMDTSKGTVKNYVERAICLYGFEVAEQKVLEDDTELPEYERVDADYWKTREGSDQREWVNLVLNYDEKLPAEFAEDVRESARENGLYLG